MGQFASSLYKLCCKEVVKEEVNTDYNTYGHEGDIDYVTNQNPDYEIDYDNMETAAGQRGTPQARVRALSWVEEIEIPECFRSPDLSNGCNGWIS